VPGGGGQRVCMGSGVPGRLGGGGQAEKGVGAGVTAGNSEIYL
jgi:hypothetical protein